MQFSKFGTKFTNNSGILELMDDLGKALASDKPSIMLGGGNPAHIEGVQKVYRKCMETILATPGEFESMITNYDAPQGNEKFIKTLVKFLRSEMNWNISEENIAIAGGSQSGFFALFNLLAGEFENGTKKRILLPITPEYIGYADQGLSADFFVSFKPIIKELDKHVYKYEVDIAAVEQYLANNAAEVGAICLSRPTNPSGNVVSDEEISKLKALGAKYDILLIIDSAYGKPFPNVLFPPAKLEWDENTIISLSLSKFGLPTARTGIIIAKPEIASAISKITAITSLTSSSYGPTIATKLFENEEMLRAVKTELRTFYFDKMLAATEYVFKYFDDEIPYSFHKVEGAFFLWMWFKDLPITSKELYQRLKEKGVIVVPGEYFFPGINDENWKHKHECIRINYARPQEQVAEGFKIIADTVKELYSGV